MSGPGEFSEKQQKDRAILREMDFALQVRQDLIAAMRAEGVGAVADLAPSVIEGIIAARSEEWRFSVEIGWEILDRHTGANLFADIGDPPPR